MEDLTINQNVVIPSAELEMTTSRSGGPGGQHANKTSSRVTVHWNLAETQAVSEEDKARLLVRLATYINAAGVVQVTSSESRSQHQNREDALERLAELVRKGLQRPKPRKKTKPSRGAQRRRLEAKRKRAQIKKSRQNPKDD